MNAHVTAYHRTKAAQFLAYANKPGISATLRVCLVNRAALALAIADEQ